MCWLVPLSTATLYPSTSGLAPVVLVVTLTLPVVAGGVGQVTAKATLAVSPATTAALREAPPVALQFGANPVTATAWPPGATPLMVPVATLPSAWLAPAAP